MKCYSKNQTNDQFFNQFIRNGAENITQNW
jgi:hypothetical protein